MALQFIDIVEIGGRVSSLSLSDKQPGILRVVGGLAHNAAIRPKTAADARKLIDWLLDNWSYPEVGS